MVIGNWQLVSIMQEISVVTSPGARASAWAAKIKSHYTYNVYNVCIVEIGAPGSVPVEIGKQLQAVNLAESPTQQGSLPEDTYILLCKVGDKNIFYATP